MEDKRVFERIAARFPLRFLNPEDGSAGRAESVDISANGVGFVTDEKLSVNTPIEIWLGIPDERLPLYTRGNVAWSQKLGESGQQQVGVRLDKAELMGLARVLWVKKRS
ncbi:MAG: PilZ domain-containing protein [Candidatus Omnitrophota bacterium]